MNTLNHLRTSWISQAVTPLLCSLVACTGLPQLITLLTR